MTWHDKTINSVLELLGTTREGLSAEECERRLSEHGRNKLEDAARKSIFVRVLEQLSDFMVLTLIGAAVISFLMSYISGDGDFVDPIIILLIVAVNAAMGVIQESKAEKAIQALKKLSAPHARVRRDGRVISIDCEDVVPGDILLLETGDMVPADARVIKSSGLKTDEAALTGEAHPQEKGEGDLSSDTPVADRSNMLFSSTLIAAGRAEAVAVETGMDTQVGNIAALIHQDQDDQTPLQERLAAIGKSLGIGALSICGLIFVMGFLRKMPPFDMFMTSVSLAVAAIPEGLPAIVTIVLAIGVQRMSAKNAIIRKLPAVETLGSASVICSDKTGTLTQSRITVTGTECDPSGIALTLAAQCCNGTDPTEKAILHRVGKVTPLRRVLEIPFDSKRKLMTVVAQVPGGYRVITKGAPELLIEKCMISAEEKKKVMTANSRLASQGKRVLAVAYRDGSSMPAAPESGLCFAGLIATEDPVRPEAAEAVRICRRAGIKTVMITGDHIETACAVARELGIMRSGDRAITGAELARLSQSALERDIERYSVFARVTPEDKLRIVKGFQSRGAVVAMTGDGVNDAPALKAADIGCAMGINGTEVAKGAADMVLADDNFSTIVEAVRQGRGIYDNIRKSIHFLLSSNIGEIITIFIAIFLGWEAPLLAIQLLWINLVTDSLPAVALGVDGIDPDIMLDKPKNPKSGLFSDGLGAEILLEGCIIGMASLIAFRIGQLGHGLVVGRTMAFAVLGMTQLVHSFDVRSRRSLFSGGLLSNRHLVGAFFICLILQAGVIAVPSLADIFKVTPLSLSQWGVVGLLSLVPAFACEMQKWFSAHEGASFHQNIKNYTS